MDRKFSGLAPRAALVAMALGAALTPSLVPDPSAAAGPAHYRKHHATAPALRKVSAPETFFPMTGGRTVHDLRTYSSKHRSTDIVAPCRSVVVAAHPGVVRLTRSGKGANRYGVRVATKDHGGLVTTTAHLSQVLVRSGQVVAAGQRIGRVGKRTATKSCRSSFSVHSNGHWRNPSTWLDTYVGHQPPVGALFGDPGFVIASFNLLGASHTRSGHAFPSAAVRMPKEYRLLRARKVDVAGLQEFQPEQKAQFDRLAKGAYGIYHFVGRKGRKDTENAVIWRKSVFSLVRGETFEIPYFNGNIRHLPVVLLRNRVTGRSAYFMNAHNPADVRGPAQHWRNRAVQIERDKMAALARTGRAVFLTGDFNDRQEAFCPLTAKMLAISPNSVPAATCDYPAGGSIDWIFGAGPTRFTWYLRDQTPKKNRLSDHPLVLAKAHLQH